MPTDKTKICNRALTKVGSRAATNIDTDDTEEAKAVLNVWDIALESILTDIQWTFATKRELLATLVETIPVNFTRELLTVVYQKPTGCLRIFEVSDPAAEWHLEEDKILSDTVGLGILYTFLNENPATYSPSFSEALSDLIASLICFQLTNSLSKTQELTQIYEEISLPKAKSQDAQTGTPKILNDNYWLNSRYAGPNIKEFG